MGADSVSLMVHSQGELLAELPDTSLRLSSFRASLHLQRHCGAQDKPGPPMVHCEKLWTKTCLSQEATRLWGHCHGQARLGHGPCPLEPAVSFRTCSHGPTLEASLL